MVYIMSRDEQETLAIRRLDELDAQKNIQMQHLKFWKRMKRRFMTGDSFLAWNISTVATWPSAGGFGYAAGLVGPAFFTAKWASLSATAGKLWGFVCSATGAVFHMVAH